MQIVIDISEELYERVMDGFILPFKTDVAIRNGTPLQKGHGRLVDESKIDYVEEIGVNKYHCGAPTIVEADEEDGEWK